MDAGHQPAAIATAEQLWLTTDPAMWAPSPTSAQRRVPNQRSAGARKTIITTTQNATRS